MTVTTCLHCGVEPTHEDFGHHFCSRGCMDAYADQAASQFHTMTEGQRAQVERAAVTAAEQAHDAGLSEDAMCRAAVEAAECAFEGLMTRDAMTDQELLRAAIDAAGGSARAFAKRPLLRNERTIRRWLKGEQPLPKEVRDYLLEVVPGGEGNTT